MSDGLRELLQEMVLQPDTENHVARIESLRHQFRHTIDPMESGYPIGKYNCVLYALGLVGRIDHDLPLLWAKTEIVQGLITEGIFAKSEPRPGAFVVWSSQLGVQHIGKLTAPDRVESKWGTGRLWAHGLTEIPIRYGDVLGFYNAIEPRSAEKYIEEFHDAAGLILP